MAASAVVLIVILVLIVVKVTSSSSGGSANRTPVTASQMAQISSVPVDTLVAAAQSAPPGTVSPPARLPATSPNLVGAGKPQVLYIGAEYCPYCAAERWAMVMALSKFGTFQNLHTTTSSSTDVNPDSPTFSFYGSTFTSPYVTFTPVELEDRLGHVLQTPSPDQVKIVDTYDAPPYIKGQAGAIPFIDLGGRFVVSGTQYDGAALSGKSFSDALNYVTAGNNPTSRAAQAAAGHLVGVTCALTGNQPASVCSSVPASLKTGVAASTGQGSSGG